jgi:hypothetical protein
MGMEVDTMPARNADLSTGKKDGLRSVSHGAQPISGVTST